MITNEHERIESEATPAHTQDALQAEPRLLTPAEVLAVAGGPTTDNDG